MILVSSCLMGLKCRYDGQVMADAGVMAYLEDKAFMLICPEQLGGLPTPRRPAELISLEPLLIQNNNMQDVTDNFVEGVHQVEALIKDKPITLAILKSKSPSCGSETIYDGTFSNQLVAGEGLLARALRQKNIKVINEKKVGTIYE